MRKCKVVTEWCANCETEVEMIWDVDQSGYKAYCPYCGKRLMLCDECQHRNEGKLTDDCDYNSQTDTCRFNQKDSRDEMIAAYNQIRKNKMKMDFADFVDMTYADAAKEYDLDRIVELVDSYDHGIDVPLKRLFEMALDDYNKNETVIIKTMFVGKDICYHCARVVGGYTTLSACEALCERYSSCDTVAEANDVLVEHEQK